jgi:hypothetical protein
MAQGPRWRRTSFGYYVPATPGDGPEARWPTQRILDIGPLIPAGGALTGWAAAFVHGVDVLDGLDHRSMRPLPIVMCSRRNMCRLANSGVRYVRGDLPPEEIREIHGIPVVAPLRATFDGARFAESLEEGVVFVDAVAHAGLGGLPELAG